MGLLYEKPERKTAQAYVPLRNVSVEASINSFTADVTLTQIFVNQENNSIEAIYVFPIEVCLVVIVICSYLNEKGLFINDL